MTKLIKRRKINKEWFKTPQAANVYIVKDLKTNKNIKKTLDTGKITEVHQLLFGHTKEVAWYSVGGFVISFSKYFLDWQNPTKNEIILFELETGLTYIDYYLGLRTWSYEE